MLKLLLIALLIYLAARAVISLSRAIRLDRPSEPPRMGPRPYDGRPPEPPRSYPRAGYPQGGRPARSDEGDVEDAKWEDL